MGMYEKISVSNFCKDALKRTDGKIAIAIAIAGLVAAIIAPMFDFSLGKNKGSMLSMKIIFFMPAFFVYYVSLVYHSARGKLSIFFNSIFLLAVPALFFYFSR